MKLIKILLLLSIFGILLGACQDQTTPSAPKVSGIWRSTVIEDNNTYEIEIVFSCSCANVNGRAEVIRTDENGMKSEIKGFLSGLYQPYYSQGQYEFDITFESTNKDMKFDFLGFLTNNDKEIVGEIIIDQLAPKEINFIKTGELSDL